MEGEIINKAQGLDEAVRYLQEHPRELIKEAARRDFLAFARFIQPGMDVQPFHKAYYSVLNEFAQGRVKKLIVTMPPQHGKALADDTPVATPGGMRRHGDLKPGDMVFNRAGEPVEVRWVSDPVEMEYVVEFSDGARIACHGKHEWVVFDKETGHERVLETGEMYDLGTEGGRFSVDAPICVEFKSRITGKDPYAYGQVVATAWKVRRIPEAYRENTSGIRARFMAGMIDAGGTVNRESGEVRVTGSCMGEGVVRDVVFILQSLGQQVENVEVTPEYVGRGLRLNRYVIVFKPVTDFPTRRAGKGIGLLQNAVRREIKGIWRKSGLGMGRCIEVEGGIYLAGASSIPTHNSEGSSRKLPAFLLGRNPDMKVAIGSYSTSFVRDFNRDVQKIIDMPGYAELFPGTFLNHSRFTASYGVYQRSSEAFDCVGHMGGLRAVGRGGALTGKTVDVMILDDVYKDYAEANSPVVREAAWKWYTTVVRTRLHNKSQELIAYTRWHSDDLVGRLEETEEIIDLESKSDLQRIPRGAWARVNFEAIKVSEKTEFDPREFGAVLWEAKHSLESLMARRNLDKVQFECLYQGHPGNAEGRLYQPFKTYVDWNEYGVLVAKGNCTDCADGGGDFLCSICYNKVVSRTARGEDGKPLVFLCVTDVVFTDDPVEVTTNSVPAMLNREGTRYAYIESNNGGKAFAKIIEPKTHATVYPFAQTQNKESRIITNAGLVAQHVVMPFDWASRWQRFHAHLTQFLRNFKANEHDDGADCVTMMVEREIMDDAPGIRRRN